MTAHSDGDDPKEGVWCEPPRDERSFSGNLTLDLVEDILLRLPVKSLIQVRCVCKSWNSLISDDPIFAKKHLRLSRSLLNRHHLISCPPIPDPRFQLWESPLSSFFNSASTSCFPRTPLSPPLNVTQDSFKVIGSCDGILCISIGTLNKYLMVWNPSINKFRTLPPSQNQPKLKPSPHGVYEFDSRMVYGFGYDSLSHNYKVVAFCCYRVGGYYLFNWVCKRVEVHILGTNIWKTVRGLSPFPFGFRVKVAKCGIFLSGTINWLKTTHISNSGKQVIFSFDLGNESYQEFLPPNDGEVDVGLGSMNLGVLRDCLCFLSHASTSVIYFWLMEEYGNKDSWIKLFVVPYGELFIGRDLMAPLCPLYILEDGQLLLDFMVELAVYNSRNRATKILQIQPILSDFLFENHVYIESLISP